MSFRKIFDDVAAFIRSQGIDVEFDCGPPLSDEDLAEAVKRSYVPLPDALIQFHRELGDGFGFFWSSDGDSEDSIFANIQVDSLEDIVSQNLDQMDFAPEWEAEFEFDGCDDPELATKTAARMRNWIHFHTEGNGDSFALETHIEPNPVVFNRMAWMDGGTGDNGFVLGPSLLDFFRDWAQVCFQFPATLYWPDVFDEEAGKVDWGSAFFDARFRL